MKGWRTRYFPLLAEFVLQDSSSGRMKIAELRRECAGVSPQDILAHHQDCVRIIMSNTDEEDRMTVLHRSLLFAAEALAMTGAPEAAAGAEETGGPPWPPEVLAALPLADTGPDGDKPDRFEAVLQHMDSGIALFDRAGTLRFLNVQMSRLLNTPRRALVGCSLRQLFFHPQLSRSIRFILIRMFKEMVHYRRYHGEFQEASGRFLLVSITQIEELEGEYLVSVKDVSEYKRIEQTAFQNDKFVMLGKIAAAIAHEIRNPLTSIRGFIQLLRPYLVEVGKEEYARIILSEIDRANDIIYEFLNSSKPSAPLKKMVLVGLLLKETALLTESEAHMKDCELHCEVYDPYMTVAIDVKQIKQVLLNMVRNAIDAIQEAGGKRKGRIDISARRENRYALITIRDNGKGMDRLTLNRLFDPFFSTKEDGTGLGLSVSYRIVRNHGGTINVESRLGEGTSFMIYLPLNEQ